MASQFNDTLCLLADSIGELPEMANAKIVVDWQKDLASIASRAVAKAGGFACFLGLTRGTNDQPKIPGPRVAYQIAIELVFKPIISDQESAPAKDVFEAVLKHVGGGLTLESLQTCQYQFTFESFDIIPLPNFLTYTITVGSTIQLRNT